MNYSRYQLTLHFRRKVKLPLIAFKTSSFG